MLYLSAIWIGNVDKWTNSPWSIQRFTLLLIWNFCCSDLSRTRQYCWHWPVGKTGELDLEVCCPVVGQHGCSWAPPTDRHSALVIVTRALLQECITGWVKEQDQAKDVGRRSRQRLVSREHGPLKLRELESQTHRRSRGLWAGSPSGKSVHILCMVLLLLARIHNFWEHVGTCVTKQGIVMPRITKT